MNTARPKKSVPKQPDRNVCRQRATAINLAKGMTIEGAMLQAGYSPSYAHDQGYKAVKRPCIQSVFTESCERIMAKRHMQFDEVVEPYFDALKAPLIVKSTQLGDAYMPLEPKTQLPYPDHAIRMSAADRLVELFGGLGSREENTEPVSSPKSAIDWLAMPIAERMVLQEELTALVQRFRQRMEQGEPEFRSQPLSSTPQARS